MNVFHEDIIDRNDEKHCDEVVKLKRTRRYKYQYMLDRQQVRKDILKHQLNMILEERKEREVIEEGKWLCSISSEGHGYGIGPAGDAVVPDAE